MWATYNHLSSITVDTFPWIAPLTLIEPRSLGPLTKILTNTAIGRYIYIHTHTYIYIYIYIYLYIVIYFSVVKHARCFRLRSKPGRQHISRISNPSVIVILSVRNRNFYVHFLHIRYRLPECPIYAKSFAFTCMWQPAISHRVPNPLWGAYILSSTDRLFRSITHTHIYIYIYIYIQGDA